MAEEQNQQQAETQETQEPEKEKKGKTVIVVIIIALVLFIGGGIYAVYTATTSQAPPAEPEEKEEVIEVIEEVMEATDEAEATEAGEATEAAEPEEKEVSDDEVMIREALLAELGLAEDEAVITFNTIAAAQAKGNVNEVGAVGGGYFLAAKDSGGWVIVYNGQANPPCADVNKYDFSTSLVPECMDAEDNLVVR